jgi:hypothetical protein
MSTTTVAEFRAMQRRGRRVPHGRGVAIAGWREFGGIRHYYRSKAEMRFAAYLEWRKQSGVYARWQPEPQTFWFEHIKRGVRSYKPDFYAEYPDGGHVWYEVKGWLDPKSRTALARMARCYPGEIVNIIDGQWFKANRMLAAIVPWWEP